jgi:DNA-binding response OmpR family regulator
MRILVVEDEPFLADMVAEGLRRQTMAVDVAYDGDTAMELVDVNEYDVLVLDRDVPGVHGDDICRSLAQRGDSLRILMLTALGTVYDRVSGLNLGADDYLAKPFAMKELIARVRALGRRVATVVPPVLHHGDVELDAPRRRASRAGRELNLTRKEFAVLEVLMRARGNVVSAEELLERAWDQHTDPFTKVVKVTMSKLRAKLGEPPVIVTVPGSGYRM